MFKRMCIIELNSENPDRDVKDKNRRTIFQRKSGRVEEEEEELNKKVVVCFRIYRKNKNNEIYSKEVCR